MLMNRREIPWEVREDADIIARFQEIKSDPERMNKAKSAIQDSINTGKKALGQQPDPTFGGRGFRNPATLGRLSVPVGYR